MGKNIYVPQLSKNLEELKIRIKDVINAVTSDMISNLSNSDTKQLRFFCPNNCGKSYKIKRSVGRHLKFKCGVEPTFECWICHKRFALKESMKKHVVQKHN
ncbi:zinc finger protein 2-like [Aphis craccivora]|uniref:Zinc finger protein 2-like n=1 Tax=Aphis craccivora TaxID=307492 RepID=A0A6G0YJ19_APHCR|nr:zinc finger protein 2-like [Aphis craccivora]